MQLATAVNSASRVMLDNISAILNVTAGLNSSGQVTITGGATAKISVGTLSTGVNLGVAVSNHSTALAKATLGAGNGSGSLLAAIVLGPGSGSGGSGSQLNATVNGKPDNSSDSSSNGTESKLATAPENSGFALAKELTERTGSLVTDDSKAADAPNGPMNEDVPEVAPDTGAQATESGMSEATVDVRSFLPQASDLLADFLPFDPATAALKAQQIHDKGEQLGKDLLQWAKETQLSSWLMAAVVAATAYEVARRRKRQSKGPQAFTGNADGSTDAWFPDSTN